MTEPELRYLLEQYLEETISESDFHILFDALARKSHEPEFNILMEELLNNPRMRGLSGNQDQEAQLIRIKSLVYAAEENISLQSTAPVKRMFNLTRWAAAASIIALIGLLVYFCNIRKVENNTSITKQENTEGSDIAPGGNKAILTLADGSTIGLDTASNGTLVQLNGTQVVKLSSGEIAYRLVGNAVAEAGWNTMSTPRGGQYELSLPDGTKVWLNAASSITYPVHFGGDERQVKVTGEVYFEVAKDKRRPFVVDVNDQSSIRVLGTHFNINSYVDDGSVNTTLLEGRIQVMAKYNRKESAVLFPGQQARLPIAKSDAQKIRVVNDANLEEVMAWKNGSFHFNRTPLVAVMRQVERWYDVDVVYENDAPPIRFGGEIKRDLKLSQLLEGLGEMGVHFEIKGKKLYVKS